MGNAAVFVRFNGAARSLSAIVLSEDAQQIADEKDKEHSAEPDSGSAAVTPPTVAVVAAAPAQHEYQDNNEYDDHL